MEEHPTIIQTIEVHQRPVGIITFVLMVVVYVLLRADYVVTNDLDLDVF